MIVEEINNYIEKNKADTKNINKLLCNFSKKKFNYLHNNKLMNKVILSTEERNIFLSYNFNISNLTFYNEIKFKKVFLQLSSDN